MSSPLGKLYLLVEDNINCDVFGNYSEELDELRLRPVYISLEY